MLGWGRVVNEPVCRGLSMNSSAGVSMRLLLRGLLKIGSGAAVSIDNAFRQQIEYGLALGRRLIGGEKIVETAVFADHNHHVMNRGRRVQAIVCPGRCKFGGRPATGHPSKGRKTQASPVQGRTAVHLQLRSGFFQNMEFKYKAAAGMG